VEGGRRTSMRGAIASFGSVLYRSRPITLMEDNFDHCKSSSEICTFFTGLQRASRTRAAAMS